jgi:hypothetical protein
MVFSYAYRFGLARERRSAPGAGWSIRGAWRAPGSVASRFVQDLPALGPLP